MRILYLHGFASSPESRKARFFSERLRHSGLSLDVPDLAEGNFSQLTITGQLKVIAQLLNNQPAMVIGSSLGGYLAALYAAQQQSVKKLILLAPAFRLHQLWVERSTSKQMKDWKATGTMPFFHHRLQRELPLHYEFMEDAARYNPMPSFDQPALIFNGTNDDVVPLEYSSHFARDHKNVCLIPLSSGHELTDVLPEIWQASEPFLFDELPNSVEAVSRI